MDRGRAADVSGDDGGLADKLSSSLDLGGRGRRWARPGPGGTDRADAARRGRAPERGAGSRLVVDPRLLQWIDGHRPWRPPDRRRSARTRRGSVGHRAGGVRVRPRRPGDARGARRARSGALVPRRRDRRSRRTRARCRGVRPHRALRRRSPHCSLGLASALRRRTGVRRPRVARARRASRGRVGPLLRTGLGRSRSGHATPRPSTSAQSTRGGRWRSRGRPTPATSRCLR